MVSWPPILSTLMMKRSRVFVLFCCFVGLSLVSCHHHSHPELQIFRYNESAGIATLDPAFAKDKALIWGCSQLYNGLVQLDSNLNVSPCIAKYWEISPDGCTYIFHLRNDVRFHKNALFKTSDSTRFVIAKDFLYSFNRILDSTVASPGLWIFNEVAPDGFSAPDDTTFIIRLKNPFAPFLSLLSMPYCSVVPIEVVDFYGEDFRNHPCGTGPFQFQYWKENVKLVLRKNPHYFEQDTLGNSLPYLDAVAITFIVDKQTAFLEFIKGNLDFMNSIDPSYKDEILTHTGQLKSKYASSINMVSTPYLNTEYLGFNMTPDNKNILNDKRIRKAINLAFDRRKMMKYMRNNVGTPGCYGFIPCGLPGFDSSSSIGYEYNPSLALQLLNDAGYPHGQGLPEINLSTTSTYLDLCKYIQQQLGIIGININIDVTPPAALREQMAQGKSPWFRGSWIADYPDAENYLSLFYTSNHAPAGPNYTHFSNAEFDRLYKKSFSEPDPQVRARYYHQMDSLVMEEAPIVVLYYDQILHFTHNYVHGLQSNAMNDLNLKQVYFSAK